MAPPMHTIAHTIAMVIVAHHVALTHHTVAVGVIAAGFLYLLAQCGHGQAQRQPQDHKYKKSLFHFRTLLFLEI
ncbi:MAG: hypothetical protein ABIF87_05630 [Pseudomonadota bacterium]